MVGNGAGSGWAAARVWAQAPARPGGVSIVQIITAASIALTILLLAFSLWKGLRRARLRPLLDVGRIVLQAATAVAIPVITGVVTSPILVLAALAIGLVLGALQGQRLQLEVEGERLFATRSMTGFAVWGVGLVLMQSAGLANRTGLVEIGQAVTWLSIGITAGLILGRHANVSSTIQSAATRSAPVVLLVVALLGACVDAAELDTVVESDGSGSFEIALGVEPDPEEPFDCETDGSVPGAYSYADNRGQGLQWCVIGFNFASLDELGDLYVSLDEGQGFITVECLSFVGDQVAYKILLQVDSNEEGDVVPWRVTLPGPIDSSNADQVDGSTATWFLGGSLGQIPLDINVGADDRCPTERFELRLTANADGTGVAMLRAPQLATGEADTAVLVADLAGGGWSVEPLAPGASTFTATQTWTRASDLQALVGSLPPLEGSTVDLIHDDASGETDFDAFVDLSFYESYWRNINPTLADPPFRLVYVQADGVLLTSGDWTDEGALTFDWTVDDAGRIFDLFATTGPGGTGVADPTQDAASDAGETDDTAPADNPDADPTDDNTSGDGETDDSVQRASTSAPALTEQQAAQALLDLLDSQDVNENEALATAIAGLAAAAAAGMLTLAEAARAAQEFADAAAANQRAAKPPVATAATAASDPSLEQAQAQPPPASPGQRPPGRLRDMDAEQLRQALPHVSRQEFERWLDALQDDIDTNVGHVLPPLLDEILGLDGIRQRLADGTVTADDLWDVLRGKELSHTAKTGESLVERANLEVIRGHLQTYGNYAEASLLTTKIASGIVGGPGGSAAITALVDSVAAREHGLATAVQIGVLHASLDFAQGSFAQAIAKLPIGQRITGGALSGGMSAWAQNIHDQLATNGGDPSKINLEAANQAGLVGMGVGGLGGIDGAAPDLPQLKGQPRGFSSDLGDGFSLRRADTPDLSPPTPARLSNLDGPPGTTRAPTLDHPAPTPTATPAPDGPVGTPTATPAPDGPVGTPTATPAPDGPVGTAMPDRPTSTGTPTATVDAPTGTAAPDSAAPGATTQIDHPTATDGGTAQLERPSASRDGRVTAPADQAHMSVRPEPNPNADLPPGRATTPETQQILDNLESSPRVGVDGGGPGRPSRLSDLDHEGNLWVGNRQVGEMNGQGRLVNANQQPIRVAHDLHSGASVGYVEVDTPGLPGRPVHNGQGQPVGRVSDSGHILNSDGSIQMHDGAPARAAIDADGNLVPYQGPDLADIRPEYDQAYSGRRLEHPNPDRTPAPDLHAMSPETRVPVLDRSGNATHMVEAVPREIHFDANGQPEFVQHQFPARAQTMGDLPLSREANPRFDPNQGDLALPTPDNWGSTAARTSLTGPDAPPSAPVVRADPTGASPTNYAATVWDGVGANADGIAVSPSGTPVVRVDAQGNFFDLSGQPVTNVAAREGRVIGFTDGGGQRWIVDDGPTP